MEIIRCDKGHFYDADQYSACPTCANEKQTAGMGGVLTTDMFDTGADPILPTEPVNPVRFPGAETIAPTEPVKNMQSKVDEYTPTQPAAYNSGSAQAPTAKPQIPVSGVDTITPTMPVNPFVTPQTPGNPVEPQKGAFSPVVGWLVCIEGEERGKDYRIRSQYNYIGRAKHMDICIPSDPYISAERAAVLAYDNQEKIFFFGPGSGHNLIRVNNDVIMNSVILKPNDVLTVGKTKLMFVPLCGENFDWNE